MSILDEFKAQASRFMPNESAFRNLHDHAHKLAQRFGEPGPDVASIKDFTIAHKEHDVPVRLYTPFDVPEAEAALGPCHVYCHGGGFIVGSVETHDGLCRRIAAASNMRVLSVEYRLAPASPFPAAVDDCERALLFALDRGEEHGIDGRKISIGGDSAGGNISAYLAQKYRRDLTAQVLLYPLMQMAEKHPHKKGWQDSLMLGYVALNYIEKAYVAGADVQDPKLSPLFEKNLSGLPPAFVLTCELDPLRAEGKAYADMLEIAGVSVRYSHQKATPHGFLNFAKTFPAARTVPVDIGIFLRAGLTR